MKIKCIILVGISLLLNSCDCWIEVKGTIISSNTSKPINGAKIEMIGRNLTSNSNPNGKFTINEMTGFCYDPKIKVTYDGHKPFILELESESNILNYRLNKDSEYVKYEEPFYPNPDNRNTFTTGTWIEKYSTNFRIEADSLIIYLEEDNLTKEIELIKKKLKEENSG